MILNVDDMRREARRRLPRAVFDFIDGGAVDELTLRRNRDAYDRLLFEPRCLVDVSDVDQSVTVLGHTLSTPVIFAPTGLCGMAAIRGELAVARAVQATGTLMALSCMSSVTLEEVARETKEQWIQLYVWRDRGLTRSVIERASAAGYSALMVTVDTQVFGQRERDVRNGATVPPRVTVRNAVDVVTRFPWFAQLARHPRIEYANYVDFTRGMPRRLSVSDFVRAQLDPSLCWDDLEWIRSLWDGPLIVKGIMSANDARRAAVNGVDAIVVSNHGGRQLDSLPATLDVLPEIVDAVQGEMEVLLDGGIRRGADVVKAVALGARACMIGRAYLWGLAVAGEAGARKVVSMLKAEIAKTLMLLGTPTIAELDRSAIRQADRNLQPLS